MELHHHALPLETVGRPGQARLAVPEAGSPIAGPREALAGLHGAVAAGPVDGQTECLGEARAVVGRAIPGQASVAIRGAEPRAEEVPTRGVVPAVKGDGPAARAKDRVLSAAATTVAGAAWETTSAHCERP